MDESAEPSRPSPSGESPEGVSPARQRLVLAIFSSTAVLLLASLMAGAFLARRQVRTSKVVSSVPRAGSNFLVVAFDSLSPSRLQSYGAARRTTPALDRLAGEGSRFERAYAPSSQSDATIVSIFSGLPPACHRGNEWPAGSTLPEVLRPMDYVTGALVGSPGARDFYGLNEKLDFFRAEGLIGRKLSRLLGREEEPHVSSTILTEQADHFIRKNRNRPFFLYVHFDDTRLPYGSPQIRPRNTFFRGDQADYARLLDALEERPCELSPEERAQAADLYDDALTAADAQLSVLLDLLNETGLAGETAVIVTGTRGEALGAGKCVGGGSGLTEEEIRVPLVVRVPRARAAVIPAEIPASLLDLTPTIARLAGAIAPPYWKGRDLSECLSGGRCPPPTGIGATRNDRASGRQESAWIQGGWKLEEGAEKKFFRIDPVSLQETDAASDASAPRADLIQALESAKSTCR